MHIEDIFEDLEAQFDAALQNEQRDTFTDNARAIEVCTLNQVKRDLIAPIIGDGFLAGLDAISPIWHVYPTKSLRNVVFHSEIDESLPKLRTFDIDLATFLDTIPTPCSVRWRIHGATEYLNSGKLHSMSGQFLFLYQANAMRPIAVPIHALEQLVIESVDNLNGDF